MNKNKNSKGFEITQERIDTINTATYFIKTIGDFAKSNKHIIQKINKVMPPSISP
jgi:hypothetical protein